MKKFQNNNNNVSLNRQNYLKSRNNYKISFENTNNMGKIQNFSKQNQLKHMRYNTEPLINKKGKNLVNIPKYFEESLQILQTIQHYVTMSAENNNKSLVFDKSKNKKIKHNKKELYIKLTSNEKFDMAKNIIDDSNKRKETYSKLFEMINISIEEIKKILLYDYNNSIKENYDNFNIIFPIKEILPFQEDLSSITVYNFSESDITEVKMIKETRPKKEQLKSALKISDESSTIINDDSYGENKNIIQIPNIINKGNNQNLSTVISTSNTNPNNNFNLNENLKNKKIYTEGNNNIVEKNKNIQLENINELTRKYSKDDIQNEKKECYLF